MRVTFTKRPNSSISNFNSLTKASKVNRLDESVILSEGIFKSVADAFRLGNLGDKLSKYAEKNKSVLKLKIKDIEGKLKQDGIDVKAIKAYENMYVKDVMNRKEDGTFSAMIQNIIDNCNNKTDHPIARKTVCYIIIFSLLILLDILRISTVALSPVASILARIILSIISINLSTKAIDGCLKQNGATIVGATLTTALQGKARMCTLLSFFMIPTIIIHYFVDSTNKFFNINKYKSFDSEKIDETEFYNPPATIYGRRTIREAKSYSVGSAKKKARSRKSLKGWV